MSENNHATIHRAKEPDAIPDFEEQLEQYQRRVEELEADSAQSHNQMLQAHLHELDALRELVKYQRAELEQLRRMAESE